MYLIFLMCGSDHFLMCEPLLYYTFHRLIHMHTYTCMHTHIHMHKYTHTHAYTYGFEINSHLFRDLKRVFNEHLEIPLALFDLCVWVQPPLCVWVQSPLCVWFQPPLCVCVLPPLCIWVQPALCVWVQPPLLLQRALSNSHSHCLTSLFAPAYPVT